MLAAVFVPASASASLLGKVVETATSTGSQVTAPVAQPKPPAAPSIPAPVATPAAPQAPVKSPIGTKPAPPAASPAPTPPSPSSAPRAPSRDVDVPSASGVAETARKAAHAVSDAPRGVAERVTPLVRGAEERVRNSADGSRGPSADAGTAGGVPSAPEPHSRKRTAPGGALSVEPARIALLRRWLARVWPAIALGSDGAILAELEGMRPLARSDVARMLLTGTAPLQGVLARSAHLQSPKAPVATADGISLRTGLEISLFVICAFAVLLAVLGSSLWVELRAARYRW